MINPFIYLQPLYPIYMIDFLTKDSELPILLKKQKSKLNKFNFDYRPKSYWGPQLIETAILSKIKGQERKEIVKKYLASKKLDTETQLIDESLPEDIRKSYGQIHPNFMGGEYLPDTKDNEVEIARVVLKSTTQDVYSFRAKKLKNKIKYSIHDEYESTFELAIKTSTKPLTFSQMVKLIEYSTFNETQDYPAVYGGSRDWQFYNGNLDLSIWDFETVHSDFYRELEEWFDIQNYIWLIEKSIVLAEDDDE